MVAAQVRKPGRRTPFGTSRGPTDTDGMRIHPQDSRLRGNGRVFKGELSFFTAKVRAGAPEWGKRRPPPRSAAAHKLRRISTSAPALRASMDAPPPPGHLPSSGSRRGRTPPLARTPARPDASPGPDTSPRPSIFPHPNASPGIVPARRCPWLYSVRMGGRVCNCRASRTCERMRARAWVQWSLNLHAAHLSRKDRPWRA